MSYAKQIIDTYAPASVETGLLVTTIEALMDCAQACMADADADLSEENLADMVECIRLCLDCADLCAATLGVLSRLASHDSGGTTLLVSACAAVCKTCGDECERHAAMHEHCRVCAEACRRCEQACRQLLLALESRGR